MKFRPYEIFLGVFLTVAVFAMGMLFDSSRRAPAAQQMSADPTKENASQSPEGGLWSWVTHDAAGFFTLWLVVVGGAQIGLFYWQLRLIRIAANDSKAAGDSAERAATATENAVDLSRKTAERQLRAYLLIDRAEFAQPEMEGGEHQPWHIHVVVRNFGATPAYGASIKASKRLAVGLPDDILLTEPVDETTSAAVIVPQGHPTTLRIGGLDHGIADFIEAGQSNQVAYIWGRVDYFDAFGHPHFTKFQMVNYFGQVHQFGFCQEGNRTDDFPSRNCCPSEDRKQPI
jgi:hypothetical protein